MRPRDTSRKPRSELLRKVDDVMLGAIEAVVDVEASLAEVKRRSAAIARKTSLVEEAEQLSKIDSNREQTAMRFIEIADEWQLVGEADTAEEEALWDRFKKADREFKRRNKILVGVAARQTPALAGGQDAERTTDGLSIVEAERQLRDLLNATPTNGPDWKVVTRAMTEYCVSMVVAWLRAGCLPEPLTLDDGLKRTLRRHWSAEEMAGVALEVSTSTVENFRDHLLPRGLWQVDKDVTLTTELRNGCASRLAHALRSYSPRGIRVKASKQIKADHPTEPSLEDGAEQLGRSGYSPAETTEALGTQENQHV